MSSNVLADRDTDTPGQQSGNPFNTKEQGNGGENKPKSMDFHRQMFEKRMNEENGKPSQSYVSPSDAIMSPASQKLSSFKQKQINKGPIKPRSLFAKPATTREKDLGPVEGEEKQ
ncbi:hypothetical protein H2203_002403 [Taxawa tesnikishii (nom. ined.)]|nr:hypothetical protein H2203_002403 [Dothideales sp. JES 119]